MKYINGKNTQKCSLKAYLISIFYLQVNIVFHSLKVSRVNGLRLILNCHFRLRDPQIAVILKCNVRRGSDGAKFVKID